jgi:hypothetical protein
MMKKIIILLSLIVVAGYAKLQLKPLPRVVAELEAKNRETVTDPTLAATFFKENFVAGGYAYKYPEETSKVLMPEESGKNGEVSLMFELNANEYSGGAVVLHGTSYDLKEEYPQGALEFWVKGAQGGEQCFVALADDEAETGIKTEVKVPLNNYGGVQPFWTLVSIPLSDFGTRGAYWNEKEKREIKNQFNWRAVTEFLVVIEKGVNKSFKIWIDDINVKRDVYDIPDNLYEPYWDEVEEVVVNHPESPEKKVVILDTLFDKTFEEPMFAGVYGGKTSYSTQPTSEPENNPIVMGLYFDNSDYSGVNLNFARSVDLSKLRDSNGGVGFWAKFKPGVTQIFIGLADDNSDNRSVSSSVLLNDYGSIDTNWNYFMIPLKEFADNGGWWDESLHMEQPGTMDWTNIFEMIVSTDKYGNRIAPGIPATMFIDQIGVLETVPGYVDPDIFWDSFVSNEAPRLLFNFEDGVENWEAISGEESSISYKVAGQDERELREKHGRFFLEFEYSMNDWGFVGYPFARFNAPKEMRDWSKHSGITFDLHSKRDVEKFELKVKDAGNEEWTTTFEVKKGWNKVTIPFRKLRKYAYYQEPGAIVDGKLDLTNVYNLSFEPKDIGVMSKVIIDNIKLTNEVSK